MFNTDGSIETDLYCYRKNGGGGGGGFSVGGERIIEFLLPPIRPIRSACCGNPTSLRRNVRKSLPISGSGLFAFLKSTTILNIDLNIEPGTSA